MTSRRPAADRIRGRRVEGLRARPIAQRAVVGPSHLGPTRWGSTILLSSLIGKLEYTGGGAMIRSLWINS